MHGRGNRAAFRGRDDFLQTACTDSDSDVERNDLLVRDAFDDSKRNTLRMELLNDLFQLLNLRHEIHEKAVFHRVVQS